MAGHSKWANIKHKKEKADAKRGKVFSRISKEIITAVKIGGEDPKSNPRLRLALQKAKQANVPNDNIDRNIKKGLSQDQADFEEITYEVYGYGGVGILAEGLTDNRNRMASEMRIATNKRGGNIATPGAVAFNFDKKGVIYIEKTGVDEEKLLNDLIEAQGEEYTEQEESYLITTDPQLFTQVKEELETSYAILDSSLEYLPKSLVACNEDDQEKNLALIAWLEDIEDIDQVTHNMES